MFGELPTSVISKMLNSFVQEFDYASAAALAQVNKRTYHVWITEIVPIVARQFAGVYRGVVIRHAAAAAIMLAPTPFARNEIVNVPGVVSLPAVRGYTDHEAVQLSIDAGLILERAEYERLAQLGYQVTPRGDMGTRTKRLQLLFGCMGMRLLHYASSSGNLTDVRDTISRAVTSVGENPVFAWEDIVYSHPRGWKQSAGHVFGGVLARQGRLAAQLDAPAAWDEPLSLTGLLACIEAHETGRLSTWSTGFGASAIEANAFGVFWSVAWMLVGGTSGPVGCTRPPALSGFVDASMAHYCAARVAGLQLAPIRMPISTEDISLYRQYQCYEAYLVRRKEPLDLGVAGGELRWLFEKLDRTQYPAAYALWDAANGAGSSGIFINAGTLCLTSPMSAMVSDNGEIEVNIRVNRRSQLVCVLRRYGQDELLVRWSLETVQLSETESEPLFMTLLRFFTKENLWQCIQLADKCTRCKRVLRTESSVARGMGVGCKRQCV